jgi:hypothetical protein
MGTSVNGSVGKYCRFETVTEQRGLIVTALVKRTIVAEAHPKKNFEEIFAKYEK